MQIEIKVKGTVTEKKEIEREISLPYYFHREHYFFMVVNDESMARINSSKGWASIDCLPLDYFKDEIYAGVEITEEEFFAAHNEAKQHLENLIMQPCASITENSL